MKRHETGFTLVEISVALLALGLVLLAAVVFWQQSARQRVAVRQMDAQDQSRDAVLGFVQAHHRLPCPAADTAGAEDCDQGQVGYLPWRTLGLPRPEAGQLRYGVYRETSAEAQDNRDLTMRMDRMNPLRVPTPFPTPSNSNAPNPNLPPLPQTVEAQLGATRSDVAFPLNGSDGATSPLDAACNASNPTPCLTTPVPRATSLIDICLALNDRKGSAYVAPPGTLAVRALGTTGSRRAMAFVIAAPGLLDADGDGQPFDGENASASNDTPTFAAAQTVMHGYDDLVLAVSHAELFAVLHCGAALAAISHAHVNAGTGALVMERSFYDYRDQLDVAVKLGDAGIAAATAGLASAVSASLDAAKEMVSATADTTMSAGARSFQIGLAAAGIAAAIAADVVAIAAETMAILSREEAYDVWSDFASRTTAMTNLAVSVNENALKADAIGY
ncbi:MAG: prepilin-type cleavage/methylation domain-containing protein [Hydrogenophaga sp.]|uniref:prepilin-type cleavage/methylation domain-containing protein n=1 Tax=Hydrogenophaga sp. TaxID=1904254 RepID=UPI00260CC273|nr:prepilin-type cleavage/methylation domain-containing protein [Hydrogenophaga sp.]MDD3786810.1 prepilin-type cleavage/methylation domain-containing protein [Hydrogenophaga sp.]